MKQPYIPAPGAMVSCPADRGDSAYEGRALYVGSKVQHNNKGDPYVWVTVRKGTGDKATRHVWPSNRLQPVGGGS
jgi:hypothetical protein